MASDRYLGIRESELNGKPYAEFWNPRLAPLSETTREALARGPVAAPLLPPVSEAPRLLEAGYHDVEHGLALAEDGSLRVAVRIDMPGVSPGMIDWWFGWHSVEPQRYKLWHPQAHVHAAWKEADPPGLRGRERYVGRTSFVEEYLGSTAGQYSIRFLRPAELGLSGPEVDDPAQGTIVCARVGFTAVPLEAGYLLHHVRRTPIGSEMRCRFWLGGSNAGGRNDQLIGAAVARVGRLVKKPTLQDGANLLVHCTQEMTHLASFLPALFARCRDVH